MKNAPIWKKFLFMSLVVFATVGILGVAGFYLWFVFPVEKINGLTYLATRDLLIYYGVINVLDVIGVNLFAWGLYFRWVKTDRPLRDGAWIGAYLLVFSWATDILVYIFIRNTLPTVNEYFFGKNQPEIGIAWIVGFSAAVLAGWLEKRRREPPAGGKTRAAVLYSAGLVLVSMLLTVIGIGFFDIRP